MVCINEIPFLGLKEKALFEKIKGRTKSSIFRFGSGSLCIHMMNDTQESGSGLMYILGKAPVIRLHQIGFQSARSLLGNRACKPYCKFWFMRGFFLPDEELDTKFFILDPDGDDVAMTNEFETSNPDDYRGGILQELPDVVYQRHAINHEDGTTSDYVVLPWLNIAPALQGIETEKKIIVIKQEEQGK